MGFEKEQTEALGWLRALFHDAPIAIGFSRDGIMLEVNASFVRFFGYANSEELRGRALLEHIAPSHRGRVQGLIVQRAQGADVPFRYETLGLRKDGTEVPFEVATTRVVLPDGPLAIAFISDISEREAAVAALKSSEERFRTLSSAAFEGVFLHSEGRIMLANEAGAAMYQLTPDAMIGMDLVSLAAPEIQSAVAARLLVNAHDPYYGKGRRQDGTLFDAEARGRTIQQGGRSIRVTVIRDITERKRIEAEQRALSERVEQAQRVESLGVLAGGVAHDFNNILTIISNSVGLAKRAFAAGATPVDHLRTIEVATQRAADLCRQMLAYSGKTRLERETLDLSALVAETSSMVESSISKSVTLVRELVPDLPTVLGDGIQIRQIVMNLVINASEAIQRQGTIRVSTGTGHYEESSFTHSPARNEPKAGPYVWLEIVDDGIGMDAPTAAQMFDPFFTTKFVGRGLGMAAVLGIVRSHDGSIDVESHPGKGTRIRIFFPALSEVANPSKYARSTS